MIEIDKRIYELRKERGLTQEDVARKLNVSRQTISNWETGAAQPTIEKAIDLANVYELSLDELVGNKFNTPKAISRILQSLINETGTLFLSLDTDVAFTMQSSKIKDCQIIEVNQNSIRILIKSKGQDIEKLMFIKDICGFEVEVV